MEATREVCQSSTSTDKGRDRDRDTMNCPREREREDRPFRSVPSSWESMTTNRRELSQSTKLREGSRDPPRAVTVQAMAVAIAEATATETATETATATAAAAAAATNVAIQASKSSPYVWRLYLPLDSPQAAVYKPEWLCFNQADASFPLQLAIQNPSFFLFYALGCYCYCSSFAIDNVTCTVAAASEAQMEIPLHFKVAFVNAPTTSAATGSRK
ncbi:hypothetical protein GGR50DRAFT_646388 [Xylaria sp. CBS 124048]|nr:hypothetical protein GGR50DRAFT_646388 [Xylaria sp. CBS 124048]